MEISPSVQTGDNSPSRGTVEWDLGGASVGPTSLRRALLHTDWCCKRPGKFSASIGSVDYAFNTASRVRLMVECAKDFSSAVFVELETEAKVPFEPIPEQKPPVEFKWEYEGPSYEGLSTNPNYPRTMPKLTSVPPDAADLEFLAYEYPLASYDFLQHVFPPQGTRATVRAGYRLNGTDTILFEGCWPFHSRQFGGKFTIGAAVADFYDKPDQQFVRCGFEFFGYGLGDIYGGNDEFTWPLDVPKSVFADPDDSTILDKRRYLAIECDGAGVEVYQGQTGEYYGVPYFAPTYNHVVSEPRALSVCLDANASGVISDDPEVTPFRFDQPFNVSGLISLTFSSCFGAGASAAVTKPFGVLGVANGPISEVVVYTGGGGYALLGRVTPTVTLDESALPSGTGAAISTTLATGTGQCGNPTWGVSGVTVDDGGYGYPESTYYCTFVTSDGVTEEAADGVIQTSSRPPELAVSLAVHATTAFVVSKISDGGTPERWSVSAVTFSGDTNGFVDNEQLTILPGENGSEFAVADVRARTVFDEDGHDTGVLDYIEVLNGGSYAIPGVIDSVSVTHPGKYYKEDASVPPLVADVTISIAQSPPSSGSNASLSAVIDEDTGSTTFGQITAVNIDNGGNGYLAGEVYPEEITESSSYYLKRFDKVRNVAHNVAHGDSWHASNLVEYGSTLAQNKGAHKLIVEFLPDPTETTGKPPLSFETGTGAGHTTTPTFMFWSDATSWAALAGSHELGPDIGDRKLVPNKYHKSYSQHSNKWDYPIVPPSDYEQAEPYVMWLMYGGSEDLILSPAQWDALKQWPATTFYEYQLRVYPKITAWTLLRPGGKSMRYGIDFAGSGMMTHDFDAAFNTVANPARMLGVDTFSLHVYFRIDIMYEVEITKIQGFRAERYQGEPYFYYVNEPTGKFHYRQNGVRSVYERDGGSVKAGRNTLYRSLAYLNFWDTYVELKISDVHTLSKGLAVDRPSWLANGSDNLSDNRKIRLRVESA